MSAPKWLLKQEGITQRQWKSQKRKELKEVIKTLDTFTLGCAYVPAYDEINQVGKLLKEAKDKLSVKKWGK